MQVLAECWPSDKPSEVYYVMSVTPASDDSTAGTIVVDRAVLSIGSAAWSFQLPAVKLSETVAAPHTSGSGVMWLFDTLGRRIIEGSARSLQDVSDYIDATAAPYTLSLLDQSQAWFGHKVELPPITTSSSTQSWTLTRASGTIGATSIYLYQAQTIYDFLNLVAPTYIIDADANVVLFHNLQMVQEVVSVTTDNTTYTQYFNTASPIQTSVTSLAVSPFIPESDLYYFDFVYGWTLLPIQSYTAALSGSGVLITVYGTGLPSTLVIRYNAAYSNSEPYMPCVTVVANGAQLSLPRPHPLWNQFDDLGLMIGIRRLRLEPATTNGSGITVPDYANASYESNIAYAKRLYAASMIPAYADRLDALSWMAIRLNLISNIKWNTTTGSLAIPTSTIVFPGVSAATTAVNLTDLSQTVTLENYPLSQDTYWRPDVHGLQTYRYYFSYPPDNTPRIFFDGTYVDRAVETEIMDVLASDGITNVPTAIYFITLTAAEAKSYTDVTATYRIKVWTESSGNIVLADQSFAGVYDVFAVQGIDLTTFWDPAFRSTLVDMYGVPNSTYRTYALQLLSRSPILTNQAVWGRSPWFTSTAVADVPQLTRLPSGWS